MRGFAGHQTIDDGVSRAFDEDLGGFQVGVDRRFSLPSGDLYVGGFGGYLSASRDFHASRDSQDGGTGETQGLSLGAYATWIEPHGWYVDGVLKYSQYWNSFRTRTLFGRLSTGDYTIPAFGGSVEVGKRFDLAAGRYFIEPQAELGGLWAEGASYQASTGLHINGDDQTSLRGRLGVRVGIHFDLPGHRAVEPYVRASVIEEVLADSVITTNSARFRPDLSGTAGRFGVGVAARLGQSTSLYGEYEYATSDQVESPWSVNLGFRWEW